MTRCPSVPGRPRSIEFKQGVPPASRRPSRRCPRRPGASPVALCPVAGSAASDTTPRTPASCWSRRRCRQVRPEQPGSPGGCCHWLPASAIRSDARCRAAFHPNRRGSRSDAKRVQRWSGSRRPYLPIASGCPCPLLRQNPRPHLAPLASVDATWDGPSAPVLQQILTERPRPGEPNLDARH